MAKYRKKPVEVEAVQLTWKAWGEVCDLLGDVISSANPGRYGAEANDACGELAPYIELTVTTIHGEPAIVRHGDWIIAEPAPGRFYPCKPDIFRQTYEPVPDE